MQAIAPGKACPGRRSRSHSPPASPHTPDRGGYRPGVWGPGRGTPLPGEKNHTGLPQGPRTGAGIVVAIPRERRSWEGNPKYCFPLASLHPPLSYPPPPTRAFGAPPPPPWAGAVQAIAPDKARPESQPRSYFPPASPPDTGPWGISPGGGGRGGAPPSPQKRTILAIPQDPRPGAGIIAAIPREGRNREGNLIHRSPISPTPPAPSALLPRPRGRGQCRRYPGKDAAGESQPRSYSPLVSLPYTGPWWISPGGGDRGGAPPSPLKRTILTIPQGSRTGAGAIVVMPRKGHSRGNNSIHRSPISSPPPAPLALLPRPRGRGQCRR